MLTSTWGTRPRTQQTRPRPQKNNCSRSRPRTNITDCESTNPCCRQADLIGTAAPFVVARWFHLPTNRNNLFQTNLIMAASVCHGSRVAITFCNRLLCLFCLFISYLFFNISIMDLGNRWGQLSQTFAASRLGGWNRTSLSQSPKIPLGGAKVKRGPKIPQT